VRYPGITRKARRAAFLRPAGLVLLIGLRAARLWTARKENRGENNEEFGGGERRLSRARLSAYPQIFPRHQTAHRRMVKPYKREQSGLFPFCAFSIEEEFEQDFTNR